MDRFGLLLVSALWFFALPGYAQPAAAGAVHTYIDAGSRVQLSYGILSPSSVAGFRYIPCQRTARCR